MTTTLGGALRPMIHIRPASDRRVDFAVWAVRQRPKVRTTTPDTFAVPDELFIDVPEPLLIGALVNGHRYVSPDEDAADGRPAPGAAELLGVATPDSLTPPVGDPAADAAAIVAATPAATVKAAMTAVLTAVDVAAANAAGHPEEEPQRTGSALPASDDGDQGDDTPEGVFPCPECNREFTTERGRDTHRRQAHREG